MESNNLLLIWINKRICATSVKVKVGRTNTFTQIVRRRQISTGLNAEELLLRGRRIGEDPDDDKSLTAVAHIEFH